MKRLKNLIFYALIFAGVIGGFMLLSRTGESDKTQASVSASNTSQISASENSYDFGEISMAAGKVSHVFKVKNPTDQPQTATKLFTSCMCTKALLKTASGEVGPFGMPGHGIVPSISQIIAPGEEATVNVVFDPAAHGPAGIGKIERLVTLQTNNGALQLKFQAQVKP
ncbi:MAG: DUF1573 domain-containing protein [Patescibacteria group bacterium]